MPRNLGERERVVPNLIATQTTVWQKCVSRTVGMGRRNESLGEMLLKSPWWVSAALGVFAFAGLRWGLHAWFGDNKSAQPFVTAAASYAPFAALLFAMFAGLSFWFGKQR